MTNKLRDEKPTPEEKCEHEQLACTQCSEVVSPSPEARKEKSLNDVIIDRADGKPVISPEARVDWESEVSELVQAAISYSMKGDYEQFVSRCKEVLSAAFEKGREAR